ncbi:hypothetical protein [Psychroflexus sediminis]|uniref:Uncharacterized protein n=1 Tax=Psychroflexus sediminis TaxID=470826 RepID=A0A1G7XDE6_9FLAO|nr:hypothetical protein [Psychroflexus sediminis]SDG82248.1 hypothetical protein SAMN04488027_10842 [Psychroflexus sediminis]
MYELYRIIEINGPGVLIILAILLFGKKMIEYFFSKTIELKKTELNQKLENYKTKLEQQNRDFQHDLDLKLNEFNIQFSKLHQDRAEVIRQLYHKIIELQSAMTVFTRKVHPIIKSAEKEKKERLDRVNKAIHNFVNYYMPNKIYFDKDLAKKLDNLSNEYRTKGWDFAQMSSHLSEYKMAKGSYDIYQKKLDKISDIVIKEFPKIIEELEDEFRTILGVK